MRLQGLNTMLPGERELEQSLRSGRLASFGARSAGRFDTQLQIAYLVFWPLWIILTIVGRLLWFVLGPVARPAWARLVRRFPVLAGIQAKAEASEPFFLPGDVASDIYGDGGAMTGPPVDIPRERVAPPWLYEDVQSRSSVSDPPPIP